MDIVRDRKEGTLKLSQEGYLKKVLRTFRMEDAKSVITPVSSQYKMKSLSDEEADFELYYMGSETGTCGALGSRSQHLTIKATRTRGVSEAEEVSIGEEGSEICWSFRDKCVVWSRRSCFGHIRSLWKVDIISVEAPEIGIEGVSKPEIGDEGDSMMLLVLTPTNYGGRSDRSRPQRGEKRGSWPESKLVSSSLIEDVKIKDGGALKRGTPPEQAREDRDFTGIEKREKIASEIVFSDKRERNTEMALGLVEVGLKPTRWRLLVVGLSPSLSACCMGWACLRCHLRKPKSKKLGFIVASYINT
ncbi:hypothetical protein YC2023_011975 [Brassica napus]